MPIDRAMGGPIYTTRSSARSESGVGALVRAPLEQPVLDKGDEGFGGQRDHRQDEHGRKDAVGIERALRGRDEETDSLPRPEELAHYGADQRDAEAHKGLLRRHQDLQPERDWRSCLGDALADVLDDAGGLAEEEGIADAGPGA